MIGVLKLIFAITFVLAISGHYDGDAAEPPGGAPSAKTTTLNAVVGPGQIMTLKKGTIKVSTLKKGKYKIVVEDNSASHNFHLTGPGVNIATGVNDVETKTWTVKLKAGTYKFVCDPHKSTKKGTFKVTK